ncbi:MAG: 2-succinyl-5-enolpyruvyl-6-hydroxy-3-cyclohexene-1-carboxylic-acid synthase [Candidatus Hydrogenedentes bacterium]|nr:2-succinyl-5-enolpyruvyl-6-hydroxy-3-cyclohexene-1-carboxylic-acid synthase [Candidatus Hydrogenedentota bacterium]
MNIPAPNLNHLWSSLIVEELVRGGVCAFFLSPGSRSSALTVAVARHGHARHVMHFDERGAAFHALGWAKATGRPAVLIATSGSAVANYWPAVVEAEASRVPLILLTADRPPELLQTGANQAIDQTKIFGSYARWTFTLPCPTRDVPPAMVLSTIDQALYRARRTPAGPVHINCMFREPLDPVETGEDFTSYLAPLGTWLESDRLHTRYSRPIAPPSIGALDRLRDAVRRAKRGLIVVGRLDQREAILTVDRLARKLNWPVFPDVTSGLRLGSGDGPYVHHYDQLLLADPFQEEAAADVVLHFGGPVTSKRLLNFLSRQSAHYVLIGDHPFRQDPTHQVSERLEADVPALCAGLAAAIDQQAVSPRVQRLAQASQLVQRVVTAWDESTENLSEIHVARAVSEQAPEDSTLFLANSMPVRDMDMYGVADGPQLFVAANRGASGIDGNIATAAGYAHQQTHPVTAIVGDLAVLHDLNSLALLRTTPSPVVLIVINNNGGGIFSFLPIARHAAWFEEYFGTPHDLTFAQAAQMFGVEYAQPVGSDAFDAVYLEALEANRPALIEVQTDREENLRQHQALQEQVRQEVETFFAGDGRTD